MPSPPSCAASSEVALHRHPTGSPPVGPKVGGIFGRLGDGTYTFDIEGVGFLQQTTVSGSDFGSSGSGRSSLTSPDGLLVVTGEFNGIPADVKASNNGIAVGDTGLQMDQHETLLLTFAPEQTDVRFNLTQW